MMAHSPDGQRLVSRKALSLGGSRERSGRGEFFAVPQDWSHLDKSRKRQCGQQKPTTLLNLNQILRGVPQKSSERARRLGPSDAPPLPLRCPSTPYFHNFAYSSYRRIAQHDIIVALR